MGRLRKAQLSALAVAIVALPAVNAQNNNGMSYDPYNPQNRGQMTSVNSSGNSTNIMPNLLDLGFGTDQGNIGPFVTMSDRQFARITALRALAELQLAQVALTKSDNPDVKAVANLIIDDHTRWQTGMQRAANYLRISLPRELDGKTKADVERISALNGPDFDQAYLREVARLQQKALTITQHEVESAGVTGFRHWAGVMVPKIQDEIRTAERGLSGNQIVSRK